MTQESEGQLTQREDKRATGTRTPLPLTAMPVRSGGAGPVPTWTVRLPVRAEQITLAKPVVVSEAVTIRVHPASETVTVRSDVRREEMELTRHGHPVVHDLSAQRKRRKRGN